MLTKSDLQQIEKIVKTIVREEVENETQALRDDLQADIAMSRMRVQADINELKDRIKNLEIRVAKMHKDLKNEIKMVVHYLDKENMKTLRRVEKIEEHLGLTSS